MKKRDEKWPRYRITVAPDDSIILEERNGRLGTWKKKDEAFFTTLFLSVIDLPAGASTFILHCNGLEHASLLGGTAGATLLGMVGVSGPLRHYLLTRYTYEPFLTLPQEVEEGSTLATLKRKVATLLSASTLVQDDARPAFWHAFSSEIDTTLPSLLKEWKRAQELTKRQATAQREVALRRNIQALTTASPPQIQKG